MRFHTRHVFILSLIQVPDPSLDESFQRRSKILFPVIYFNFYAISIGVRLDINHLRGLVARLLMPVQRRPRNSIRIQPAPTQAAKTFETTLYSDQGGI